MIAKYIPDKFRMTAPLAIAALGVILEIFNLKTSHFCYCAAIIFAIQFGGPIRVVK